MEGAAVIKGKLTAIRNVGTHKCGVLTIHIPEEEVLDAIAAFGWPTTSHPVEVAVAYINPVQPAGAGIPPAGAGEGEEFLSSSPKSSKGGVLSMEAGRMSQSPHFQKYVDEKMGGVDPADAIRRHCGVMSRKSLDSDPIAAEKFLKLNRDYSRWMTEKVSSERY